MDYIDFIDSKDIREFNRKSVFSPAEMAVLVIASEHTSVEMKIHVLNELMHEYGTSLDDISCLSIGGCNALDKDAGFMTN